MVLPTYGGGVPDPNRPGYYAGKPVASFPAPVADHGSHRGGTGRTGHNGDGSGVNDLNGLINPPLDPLADISYYGFDRGLNKGYMVRVAPSVVDYAAKNIPIRQRQRFRFMYNPAELTFSNQVFAGATPPGYLDTHDTWQGRFAGQEHVSFQLMLDRTQEAYIYGPNTRGTMVDIDALYRVINGNDDPSAPDGNPGFMYLSEIAVVFGGIDTGGKTTLPVYPGYVTQLSIDHTQFTPRMVPIRTVVSMTVNRLTGFTSLNAANALLQSAPSS